MPGTFVRHVLDNSFRCWRAKRARGRECDLQPIATAPQPHAPHHDLAFDASTPMPRIINLENNNVAVPAHPAGITLKWVPTGMARRYVTCRIPVYLLVELRRGQDWILCSLTCSYMRCRARSRRDPNRPRSNKARCMGIISTPPVADREGRAPLFFIRETSANEQEAQSQIHSCSFT